MGPYRHKYVRTFVKRSVITGQRHIISHLNGSHLEIIIFVYKLYAFYKLTPKEGKTIEEVVEENFQKLLGKAMRLSNDNDSLLFAWEKSMLTDKTAMKGQACELYLKGLKDVEYCPITLAKMNGLK